MQAIAKTIKAGKRVWCDEVIGACDCDGCGREMKKSVRRGESVPKALRCRECNHVTEISGLEVGDTQESE